MKKSIGAKAIACPSPVWCVGTYDGEGKANVMTASWGGICCSSPPAVSVSLRKATYTYQCILDSSAFTVSVPASRDVRAADYVGIASGKEHDKFKSAGLTAVRSKVVNAPYVAEFPLVLECSLTHHHELGLHTLFVGEIKDVKADEEVLSEDGNIDILRVDPVIFSAPNRTYHRLGDGLGKAFSIGRNYPDDRSGRD